MGFGERMLTCFKIHWNGFFYILSPLVMLPLIFLEPVKEYRAIFVIVLMFLWFIFDVIPQGITGTMPIILLPLLGVLKSHDICMSYTFDPQIIFLCCMFIGITIEHSQLSKRYAFSILYHVSFDPKIVLIILMCIAYGMASILPAGFVCALLVPIVKSILQIFDTINVCKTVDESVALKDDELPCPSKVASAYYIGMAYAVNLGCFTTAIASDSGLALRDIIEKETSLAPLKDMFHIKYFIISFVLSLLLLKFIIFYLLYIFMGLMRPESPAAQNIAYDKAASQTALDAVRLDLPPYNAHMITTAVLYFLSLVGVLVVAIVKPEIENKSIKFSTNAMLLSFFYFVLPASCFFCNYFRCQKPKELKAITSVLPWIAVHKMTPWKNFLLFGSSSAIGLTMKETSLHMFVGDGLLTEKSLSKQQLGLMTLTFVLTIMGSNDFVSNIMLDMANMAKGENSGAQLLYPVAWCCNLTFLLPISSLANVYVFGFGNLRNKDMMFAGIGPSVFGFLLAFIVAMAMPSFSWYN